MRHIADHYRRLERFEHSGPDFFVIEYMRQKRIIGVDDYKWAMRHTERHDCDSLVDFGHKIAEMRRKEGKSSEEPYDLEKGDRHRRRHISSKSKGKGTGWSGSYSSSQGRREPVYDLEKEDRRMQREKGLEVSSPFAHFTCVSGPMSHNLYTDRQTSHMGIQFPQAALRPRLQQHR